ncbi:zinc finger, CCHC-type containing protein [Tanacetum coccineum]
MVAAAMKHMALNFAKLDKFEGVDFRRWQKKMHYLISSMSVVYVLTTPIPVMVVKMQTWNRSRKGPSGTMMTITIGFLGGQIYGWDASSKKFLVSNFINYKMIDSRPVLEQYNELLGILGRFTQHKMNMDEAIQVSCIIDKLPPSWKDFKHTLKHLKEELTLVELGSHMRLGRPFKVQDCDSKRYNDNKGKRKHHDNTRADPNKKAKPTCWKCGKTGHIKRDCKGVNIGNKANGSGTRSSVDGLSNLLKGATIHVCKDRCWFKTYESLNDGSILHMVNESIALVHGRSCVDLRFCYVYLLHTKNEALDKFKVFKTEVEVQQGSLIKIFRTDRGGLSQGFWGEAMAVGRLPDPKLKTLGERGIERIFIGYAEHSKASRFYVIEPNDLVSINLIIELKDAIFDENRFFPRPSLRIPNGTEDISGFVVLEEVTKEVVQQPEPEL